MGLCSRYKVRYYLLGDLKEMKEITAVEIDEKIKEVTTAKPYACKFADRVYCSMKAYKNKYNVLYAPTRYGKSAVAQMMSYLHWRNYNTRAKTCFITSMTMCDTREANPRLIKAGIELFSINLKEKGKFVKFLQENKKNEILLIHDEGDFGTNEKSTFSDLTEEINKYQNIKYINMTATPFEPLFALRDALGDKEENASFFYPQKEIGEFDPEYYSLIDSLNDGNVFDTKNKDILDSDETLSKFLIQELNCFMKSSKKLFFLRIPTSTAFVTVFNKILETIANTEELKGKLEAEHKTSKSKETLKNKCSSSLFDNGSDFNTFYYAITNPKSPKKLLVIDQALRRGSEIDERLKTEIYAWCDPPTSTTTLATLCQSNGRICSSKGKNDIKLFTNKSQVEFFKNIIQSIEENNPKTVDEACKVIESIPNFEDEFDKISSRVSKITANDYLIYAASEISGKGTKFVGLLPQNPSMETRNKWLENHLKPAMIEIHGILEGKFEEENQGEFSGIQIDQRMNDLKKNEYWKEFTYENKKPVVCLINTTYYGKGKGLPFLTKEENDKKLKQSSRSANKRYEILFYNKILDSGDVEVWLDGVVSIKNTDPKVEINSNKSALNDLK